MKLLPFVENWRPIGDQIDAAGLLEQTDTQSGVTEAQVPPMLASKPLKNQAFQQNRPDSFTNVQHPFVGPPRAYSIHDGRRKSHFLRRVVATLGSLYYTVTLKIRGIFYRYGTPTNLELSEMSWDTKTITVHQDDLTFLGDGEFDWSEGHVRSVISYAFNKTEIGEQANYRNFGITEVVSGNDNSKAAYMETDSGYFILSASMLLHLIVTYSRWD